MPAKKRAAALEVMLTDPSVPREQRLALVHQLAIHQHQESASVLGNLLDRAAAANGKDQYAKKLAEVNKTLEDMKAGPQRCATFVGRSNGSPVRAHVILQDGTSAFVAVPDRAVGDSLRVGDTVLIEATGKALVDRWPSLPEAGEEARFERRIQERHVEVVLRDHDPHIFLVSDALKEKLDRDEVPCGSTLLVCSRRQIAFCDVPPPEGKSHYRFLARGPVPDVVIQRDIGSPPKFLTELSQHVRREMTDPALGSLYRINRSVTKLLVGPSGTGKTLCVEGFIRCCYEIMSEICGVPIDDLPHRVMRIRVSHLLSKWLGESDKNLDRFFDEVEQLAGETFIAPDGREYELPVIVCFEEADALARKRGEDAIYDRIQATMLQRLDATYKGLRDKLIVFLFTTNLPTLLDPAFVRRAGGTVERLGRLDKRSFVAVLDRQLRDRPYASENGEDQTRARRRIMTEVAGWLFSPQDKGQVELRFVSSATPVVKCRKDFLTGGLVDRAVQQASSRACEAQRNGCESPGITSEMLITALHQQVRSVVDALDVDNVFHHLTLPDGVRVASIRRIEQPSILPIELERRP